MTTYKVMHQRGTSSWDSGLSLPDALDSAANASKILGCHPYLINEETDEIIKLAAIGTRPEPKYEVIKKSRTDAA
jgi:hypothetical protein